MVPCTARGLNGPRSCTMSVDLDRPQMRRACLSAQAELLVNLFGQEPHRLIPS